MIPLNKYTIKQKIWLFSTNIKRVLNFLVSDNRCPALKNQPLFKVNMFFFYKYSGTNPHNGTPKKKKKNWIMIDREESIKIKSIITKCWPWVYGAAEKRPNRVGVKLKIGRRKRFYFTVLSFAECRGFIFSLRWVLFD